MRTTLIFGFLAVAVTFALAKPGIVNTKDGRSIEGDITETEAEVTVATKVASITFNRTDIASVTYATSIKEQYEKRLAALPKNAGARSHVDLASWLFENKEYALARAEVDKALQLDPNNADAAVLRQTIERTTLWEKTRPVAPAVIPGSVPKPNVAPAVAVPKDQNYLNADQINIIRQMELRESDPPPRLRLDKDVKQRYIKAQNLTPKEFNTLPENDKGMQILRNGSPDMKADVKILSDPPSLAGFKRIQPSILLGCASANCHGSTKAGTFMLYNPASTDAAAYTNFYILTQYKPFLGGVLHKSIDRQQHRNSLLLDYGLPRDQAETPHPDVPGWTPMFRGVQDLKYVAIQRWIESLHPIEPDYGISFALPGGPPAAAPTAPATQPAETDQPVPADRNPAAPAPAAPAPAERPGNSGGDSNETLKEIRGRMRPIRGL